MWPWQSYDLCFPVFFFCRALGFCQNTQWSRFERHTAILFLFSLFLPLHLGSNCSYKVTSYNCLTTGKSSRYLWGLHVSASSFSFLSHLTAFTTFSDITDKLEATQISDLNAIYLFLKVTWFIGLVFTLSATVFHLLFTSVG